ncbi:hypothetical protein K402DRAFT_389416 [Aulographum hederae CBS 113979]|uniref:Uncharacterized protein n=1 Tax=Aulographum hederae CBS 113979 TaxID=1176131 RepID=A0A6G1HDU2_9PEZI|nr:hypothetical protein K402DRAFT_389416 [Aulographum hederae CBS 113979]
MLCLSTLMILLAAIAAPILSAFQLAPDCTDFLSALTLSEGCELMEGGTYLDLNARARLLKDVRLKIGDGDPGGDVGKVVIGREADLEDLKGGRLYQ